MHVGAALADEVDPRDPAVDDAVLHVLGDIGGANEQHLDRCVAAREGKGAVTRLLGPEAGVFEQVERGLAQPALDRNGDPQEAERSSATRYPPSPCLSQCATRVTVVVEAPVRSAISR